MLRFKVVLIDPTNATREEERMTLCTTKESVDSWVATMLAAAGEGSYIKIFERTEALIHTVRMAPKELQAE